MPAPWLERTNPPSVAELVDDFATWAWLTCTIADRVGREIQFVENPMQRHLNAIEDRMRAEHGYVWLYELKMRRGGLSLNTQLRNLWRVWRERNARGITLAHDDESAQEIFEITRRAVLSFPQELLHPMSRERMKAVNFFERGSRFLTRTAGAQGLGRGADLAFLHVSEFAFVKEPKKLHTSASQALRANGTYILETTASGYGSDAHQMWQEAAAGHSKFKAVFYPWWWRDDAYLPVADPDELEPLSTEELAIRERIAEHQVWLVQHYYQTRPDADRIRLRIAEQLTWRREKIREIGATDFDREYPKDDTTCWLMAGLRYFDVDALKWALEVTVREPIRTEWNGELRIYTEPDPNRRYLIGGDVSEGTGNDRSTLEVLDWETFEQCAVFSSRVCTPQDLGDKMAILGRRYASAKYGPAVLVPERNSMGHTTVYQLLHVTKPKYPWGKIWRQTKMVKNVRTEEPGWRTTEETKYIALNDGAELLRNAFEARRPILYDRETVVDLMGVERGEKGTVELTGKDCAVGWLLAYQGRKHPVTSGMPGMDPNAKKDLTPAAAAVQRKH